MLIGIANVVLNVGLNFALRPLLGVAGIALSTTLTIAILAAVYAIAAQRRWQAIDLRGHGSAIAFAALSTIAIAAVAFGLLRALPTATSRAQALLSIVSVAGVGFALHAVVVLVREPSLHALPAADRNRGIAVAAARYDVVFYVPSVTPLLTRRDVAPPGGAETQIFLLTRALARQGARVCLVVFESAGDEIPAAIDGVDIVVRPRYQAHRIP